MKKPKKIKEGLAILLCACMVSGTTPLPARAESFTDGFVAETENTNVDASAQMPASVEPQTNAESNSEPQTPAASEPQTNAETNAPSQEPAPVETEGESEADFSSQDPVVIEPETAPSSQDPVEEVQKLIHALPDAKGITEENITQKPLVNMAMSDRTTLTGGKQSIVMNVTWSIPEGYEIIEAGLVRTLEDAYSNQLGLDKVDKKNVKKNPSKLTTAEGTMTYILTLGAVSAKKNLYARGYLTYRNVVSGEVTTVYTDTFTSNVYNN